jgi:periplasmic divalent cation tolerance protein
MYSIVLTTTDSREIAEQIAKSLIEQKLAACVQIDEVESFYDWEGKYTVSNEFRLMIKSKQNLYHMVEACIKSSHNYRIPQIIQLDVSNGLSEYLQWASSILR